MTTPPTLRGLRADFPHLDISIEFLATYRAWSARGRDGRNPWLVLSTDLGRFRRLSTAPTGSSDPARQPHPPGRSPPPAAPP